MTNQNPPPQSDGGDWGFSGESINLRHYWHVVLERRWLVITAFVSVFVLCVIYLLKAEKIYQATSRIQIDREQESAVNLRDVLAVNAGDQDYLQTQYKNLMSRTLIQTVVDKLKLDKDDPRYAKELDPVKALADDITVAPIRLSRLVDIKAEHPSPKQAALIANTLVDEYINRNLSQKQKKVLDMVFFLRTEANSLEGDVEKNDEALQKYREEKRLVVMENNQSIVAQALSQAQADLVKAQNEASILQTAVQQLEKYRAEGKPLEGFPNVASDVQVKALQAELARMQADLAALGKRYLAKHPRIVEARGKITDLQKSIQTAAEQAAATLLTQASIALNTVTNLQVTVETKKAEHLELSQLRVQYDVLSRKAETSKLLFNQVLGKMKEIDLLSKDKGNNIKVIDNAVDPVRPVKPRVVITLLLGMFGGLGVAFGLAFFVNYLDDSIKSQDDIETYLRLPFMGYIPNIKSNSVVERDLQAHMHPQSNAAEAFRTVRAALALSQNSGKLRTLCVSSTIPSEGKSLVASNLAIVLAQTGLKTLIIDADLRRPSVHKAFQLHSPVGLSAYLQETATSVDELIHSSDVPNLDVVCCGAVPNAPSELIGSKRMTQFLQEVARRYDRVVLDCPPVSAVSDPLVLASMSDGLVFVTKFNKIRREHARKTIQRIQDSGIHICGVILNDIDFEGRDSYYYSYYYYQNRYYSSHYRSARKEDEPEEPVGTAKKS